MDSFEKILLFHFEKYPKMKPIDAVKLCYQSAFGCGHLVKNEESALSMLRKELLETKSDAGAQLFEPIGENYVRLDLHRAKADDIPESEICRIFIESANSGVKTEIEPKLRLLEKLAEEGRTPFPEKELSEYLSAYNGGMMSHSKEYKAEYNPAYRVVLRKPEENLQ